MSKKPKVTKTRTKTKAISEAKQMTPSAFFRALAATEKRYAWYVNSSGRIRAAVGIDTVCPLTAVCLNRTGVFVDTHRPSAARNELGISTDFASDIVYAADSNLDKLDSEAGKMRQKLLTATGLSGV